MHIKIGKDTSRDLSINKSGEEEENYRSCSLQLYFLEDAARSKRSRSLKNVNKLFFFVNNYHHALGIVSKVKTEHYA